MITQLCKIKKVFLIVVLVAFSLNISHNVKASDIDDLTNAINQFNIDEQYRHNNKKFQDNRMMWKNKLDREWDSHTNSINKQNDFNNNLMRDMSNIIIEDAGRRQRLVDSFYALTAEQRIEYLNALPDSRRSVAVNIIFNSLSDEDKIDEFYKFDNKDKKFILYALNNNIEGKKIEYEKCLSKDNSYYSNSICIKPSLPQWFKVISRQ